MMYSNVWIESIRGCTYYVGFIDDHIKKVWVYFMKHKGEVFQHFLFSLIFCIAFCMRLRLPHFSITSILQCVHTHPIDFMGIHLLSCVHGNECIGGHHAIPDTFVAITWNDGFPRGMKAITCASFNHIQLFSSMNWHCAYQRWHSHLNWCCHCQPNTSGFTSMILCNSRICYFWCSSSQEKDLSQPSPHWSIPPLSNWSIWLLTQTCWCVFTQLCQCHLDLERDKRPSSFYFNHFFLSKGFDHIIKNKSIFYLSWAVAIGLATSLTSTPSRHTSHHHGQSITSYRFFTCKYGRPSIGSQLWTWRDFHSYFESTWYLITSLFFFILFLCTFP